MIFSVSCNLISCFTREWLFSDVDILVEACRIGSTSLCEEAIQSSLCLKDEESCTLKSRAE